jgi:toxin ParE1/3/4
MARVVITASADADSAAILDYLNVKAGQPTVVKYRALFRRLYDRLADHPDSGAPRPALGPSIRIGVVSPYIVIYRHVEAADIVTILRIVHGRRRITGKLLRESPA